MSSSLESLSRSRDGFTVHFWQSFHSDCTWFVYVAAARPFGGLPVSPFSSRFHKIAFVQENRPFNSREKAHAYYLKKCAEFHLPSPR